MAPKPRTLLLALGALAICPALPTSLVLAQATSEATADPTAAPEAPAAVVAPPQPPAPVTRAPIQPPSPTLRPTAQEQRPLPARPFDQQLDRLDSNGAFTPDERAGRVRTRNLMALPANQRDMLCRSGALSQRDCSTGVVVQVRGNGNPNGAFAAGDIAGGGGARPAGFSTDAAPLPPISVPVSALLAGAGGSFRLTDVFGRTPRPAPAAGNGNSRLLFPLIGSAVTSSGFGWRLHPVLGSWLMHAGKDLAAPEGTPVVASLSGKVVSSGLAGGYGLAIEIEHDNPRRRTLYGHLSELYVREGQTVRQGEVIGRVGSTGLSTGPHLHFELRLPQEGGWVAVDPGQFDPGGLFPPGSPGQPGGVPTDAVALLMGQLVQSLERPRSPLGDPGLATPRPLPPQRNLPAPAPLPPRSQG